MYTHLNVTSNSMVVLAVIAVILLIVVLPQLFAWMGDQDDNDHAFMPRGEVAPGVRSES
jgi:hypothetical protein